MVKQVEDKIDHDLLTEKIIKWKSRGIYCGQRKNPDLFNYVKTHVIRADVKYDATRTTWKKERCMFYLGCLAFVGYFREMKPKMRTIPTVELTFNNSPAHYDKHDIGLDINDVINGALKKAIWRHIVRMYYIDQHKMPYIARYYGLTQQRIHQIIKYSIGKMQAYCRKNGIQFTDF